VLSGEEALVTGALGMMHRHILQPLRVPVPPASVEGAIGRYRDAVVRVEEENGTRPDRRLDALVGSAVMAALGRHPGGRLAGRGTIAQRERE
jgi:sulfite reductase beta subunit-like hemoprotein